MQKRKATAAINAQALSVAEACQRYGLGMNSVRKVAVNAGAVIRIGKRYLIHVPTMDAYMSTLCGKDAH